MWKEVGAAHLDLTPWIRPGDTVVWTQGTGEPLTLTETMVRQRHAIGGFRAFLGTNYSKTVRPEHADTMSFIGMGAIGNNRAFCKAGLVDIVPCHLSDLPRLFERGIIKADVMLVQLSPERDGRFSFGAVSMYVSAAMANARVIIAEVNERAPWTFASTPVDASRIDVVVRTSRPLIEIPSRSPNQLDEAIARHVVPFVPDGAVLQIGIGALPNAVLSGLRGHRDLGIHSGIIGDGVIDLIESGVVTNASKPFDAGVSVTGAMFGTERLYALAHRNPRLRVEPVGYTHDPARVSRFESFITINSAVEVDLTGQINGETAGREYLGTIGGQTDFIRGALASPKGRSIIALPTTVESKGNGTGASRIVAQIGAGVTTTARADADVVATEFGAAELRGRTIRERVRAMIAIAHPMHREALEREARNLVAGYA
ncbi:MAG: acetyl-CoA hydrolase/transferase family protein [Betaproteobacteria bacterium]|nr:acetyl-CoA hydrolase/transferase family protein [Betaproteobacteria bacterium]